MKNTGSIIKKTTPYWPQANGEVERMNSTILKRLRISQEEKNKHWKWDLRSFLLMYNSTPHSITGVAPSALMFGRILRDNLPNLHLSVNVLPEEIRDRDWMKKLEAVGKSDAQRNAKKKDLNKGDVVVAKRIIKENKLATNYGSELFEIISRNGTEVQIRSKESGKVYTRNVAHLKRFVEGAGTECQESNETMDQTEAVREDTEADGTPTDLKNSAAVESSSARRSRRELRTPQYLKNYITHVTDNYCFQG